ncbi:hypothetical protein ACHHYP_17353, partial [Achlya hypogyna]
CSSDSPLIATPSLLNQARVSSLRKIFLDAPSQLANFCIEVLGLCITADKEKNLHETLAHCERRFVLFSYATVLGTVGMSSDRALFVFAGSLVPSLFMDADDRLIGTLVFKGRCYAIFPTVDVGPRARNSTLNIAALTCKRVRELQAAAAESTANAARAADRPAAAASSVAPPAARPAAPRPPAQKKGRDASPGRAPKVQKTVNGAPLELTNPFDVLKERWSVGTTVREGYKMGSGASIPTTVRLSVRARDTSPQRDTAGLVISTAKVDALVPKVVPVPLDALLAEFAASDAKLTEERARSLFLSCTTTLRIESLCNHLVTQPLRCAKFLGALHAEHHDEFVQLTRVWMLHRVLAAPHGGGCGFKDAFKHLLVGATDRLPGLDDMFAAEVFTDRTTTRTFTDDTGIEHPFTVVHLEMTVAVTELLLMTHAPEFFFSGVALIAQLDTGIGATTTVGSMRLLSTATLMAPLHATPLVTHLRSIAMRWFDASDLDLRDSKQTVLSSKRLLASTKVISPNLLGPSPSISVTTINLNGLRGNGHGVAKELQTRLSNAQQHDKFEFHLEHEVDLFKSKVFVSDHRMHAQLPSQSRSSGVASYFHESWPGFDELQHLSALDVPGRYLVVRTEWDSHPVYVHNVYAPVRHEDRGAFYRGLPRDFEAMSLHTVGGDFNMYLDVLAQRLRHTYVR